MDDTYEAEAPQAEATPTGEGEANPRESDRALVRKLMKRINRDKAHHKDAFAQMRKDMFVARQGRDPEWSDKNYVANIIGRHVKQKTASLYAKNPKAVAKRRETLDFAIWDESPETLLAAFQMTQEAAAIGLPAPAAPGMPPDGMGAMQPGMMPSISPALLEAQAVIQDFQAGMARRKMITQLGKTLEILFSYGMREQKPIDFKTGMKKLVRRTCTTGVGYIEIGFQREYGRNPEVEAKLADARSRLDHLRRLSLDIAEGEIEPDDPEMAELEFAIQSLTSEPEIVLREGLVYGYPRSTHVIPDRACKSLVGFEGARHLTVAYFYLPDEVREMFPEADLGARWTAHRPDGGRVDDKAVVLDADGFVDLDTMTDTIREQPDGMVCVYKHFDKLSGLVYYLADGHPDFLKRPAAPDVFVEDFWPVYAITFNDVESEDKLFPPSDVALLQGMQDDYNRSRQGHREHRKAARPRFYAAKGAIDGDDIPKLAQAEAFSVTMLNLAPGEKVSDKLAAFEIPGVDPNLYDTSHIFTDMQLVGGSQEANYGGVAKATATESAIAANSTASTDNAAIDDVDAFLTVIARASGQILLGQMSAEKVKEIVGPGAVWPEMTLTEIASELTLEVEAGSSGRPNRAVEVQNWQQLVPVLMQVPGVNPVWLARETIRRLDDRVDVNEALAAGLPSIMSMNRQTQIGTGDPATDPNSQGAQGGNNGQHPPEQQRGSKPAFGSNQV